MAELKVAADLLDRGCSISIPFGEDSDYDLIAGYGRVLHRVQVKYSTSNGETIPVRCRSFSLTKGRVRQIKRYSATMIDWIAAYDPTSDRCYYCPRNRAWGGAEASCVCGWLLPATGRRSASGTPSITSIRT